jgi:hypothetical protein
MTRALTPQGPTTRDTPPRPLSAHALPAGEVLDRLGVDAERGLDEAEVEARRAASGPNQLAEQPAPPGGAASWGSSWSRSSESSSPPRSSPA